MTWWPDPDDEPYHPEPLSRVEDTENPVVATLLGPDGEPLFLVYERPRIAMGYWPGKEASRIERL